MCIIRRHPLEHLWQKIQLFWTQSCALDYKVSSKLSNLWIWLPHDSSTTKKSLKLTPLTIKWVHNGQFILPLFILPGMHDTWVLSGKSSIFSLGKLQSQSFQKQNSSHRLATFFNCIFFLDVQLNIWLEKFRQALRFGLIIIQDACGYNYEWFNSLFQLFVLHQQKLLEQFWGILARLSRIQVIINFVTI